MERGLPGRLTLGHRRLLCRAVVKESPWVQDYGVDQVGDIRGRRQVAPNQCMPRPDGLPVEASRCNSPAVAGCVGRIGVPNYTTGYSRRGSLGLLPPPERTHG
jgi:hypothetical protein